jgi:hypothetical protein
MRASLIATLARPDWWAMALAAFLVRGGFVLVVLPLVSLPSVAAIAAVVAPVVESLVIGGQTVEAVVIGAVALAIVLAALAALGLAGAWFDLELSREVAGDDELELAWAPVRGSARQAFAIRLFAHVPTALALTYGAARIVAVAYDELISPGDATVPVVARVFERTPEAVILVVLAWLVGETVGALAVRRVTAGASLGSALLVSVRQLVHPRGLATVGLTSVVLVGIGVPFLVAAGRTWEHVRAYLLDGADIVPLAAALVLLVATWILGLSILGAGLAWRASAWSAEVNGA